MSAAAGAAPTIPPPPVPLKCNIFKLTRGTVLHRIHHEKLGARDFNPGFGESRFAPVELTAAKVPTAYGATSLHCAVFETIFHEIDASAAFKSVRWSAIEPLLYSTLELTRGLRLAPLFSADLMKWGIERSQLIDTPKSAYRQTRVWAPAIHASAARPDGIVWVSRKYDEDKALMLFGDRVAAADLNPQATVRIASHAPTLEVVVDLAQRAGIVITR